MNMPIPAWFNTAVRASLFSALLILAGCAGSSEMTGEESGDGAVVQGDDAARDMAIGEETVVITDTTASVTPPTDDTELGTLLTPVIPAQPGMRGPTWRDALDIPVGFFGVWTKRQYERAVAGPGLNGVDLLQQEFDRLSAIGATHIMVLLFNEAAHVDAAEDGHLRPGVGVRFAAEWNDKRDVMIMDDRVPGPPHDRPKSSEQVFERFAEHTDLDSAAIRQDAFDLLDEIVESMVDRYGDSGAVPYFLALDEGWGRDKGGKAERQYSMLFDHYVSKVRSLDRTRPIAITQAYPLVKRRSLYPWLAEDDHPGTVDSVFAGKMMRGWNILMEDHYPFKPLYGTRDRVLQGYAGPRYHRMLFLEQIVYNRELSREVDRYASIVDPVGPTPEWWKIIQLHRLEYVYPDGSTKLIARRPTNREYALQAYMGLACGAQGVSAYTYVSAPFMGDYTTLAGETLAPERPLRKRDWLFTNTHGIISHAWMDESDSLELDMFRAPLSEEFGHADYFSEGTLVEPYPGLHYPWDRVRDLYTDLHQLLPMMRNLRYWWATDGLDRGYTDRAGNEGRMVVQRRPLRAWMEDPDVIHDGHTLGHRFRLRGITGEDERPLPQGEYYASNVLVGMFDNPDDPDWEYYFLVNMSPNAIQGDVVVDNTTPTTATLNFNGVLGLEAEVVWMDRRRNEEDGLGVERGQRALKQLDVRLLPGDAKLLRVRSLPSPTGR